MMQIVKSPSGEDSDYEPRFSNSSSSCVFGPLICLDSPRKGLYNKLPQEPLRLTILKLDGSSFGIAVSKKGTIGELKRAVETEFSHFPKKGTDSISWAHVWGQFCLCYEGQKLLSDGDSLRLYGIKDGDMLQFVRLRSNYELVETESERREQYLVDEPSISDGYKDELYNGTEDDSSGIEILGDSLDGVESETSNDENRSLCFGGWFSYRRLGSLQTRMEDGSPSRSSHSLLGSFKKIFHCNSNKYDSPTENWKGD